MSPLRRMLISKGKSQGWLAKQLRVSQATVCCWLSGTKKPKPARVLELASLFGVSGMEMTHILWPEHGSEET